MGLHLKRLGNMWWPSFAFARTIIGSLCIHWGMLMVVGLKLENVSVPPSGILGGFVTLGCDYLLESDTLYSLKWYRDGHEFFRFFPGNRHSPITTFNLSGVHVDSGESMKVQHSQVRFRLKNLDLNSGGTFRCEISADSPSFQTLHNEGNLSVIALPDSPKVVMAGFPPVVQYGDRINGNCTFSDTFPAAELTLYLNNAKINNSNENGVDLIHYKHLEVGQRLTSIVGAKFRAAPKHFLLGVLQIRCEAKLGNQLRWETLRNITHQNYQAQLHSAGQNRYPSGDGGSTTNRVSWMSAVTLIIYFFQHWIFTENFASK